jgi:molybdopterin synthase catalytic subunit
MTTERHLFRGRLGDRELAEIQRLTATRPCGGVNIFQGVTRADVVDGQPVIALEYEAYEPMADREIRRLRIETERRFAAWTFVRHRLGLVRAGETGVIVAAGANHRDGAYAASRFLIDRIKHDVPIWKKEHYVRREPRWVRCDHEHPREHAHARA